MKPTPTRTSPAQRGYVVHGPNERHLECYADGGTYSVQCYAADQWGISPKQQHRISVMLAENQDGTPYLHTATE